MKRARFHTVLTQLPVPCLERSSVNIPLAAGYLKAAAVSAGAATAESITILETGNPFADGEARLRRRILDSAPDLVGFSLYTWNIERSAFLARSLKEENPEVVSLAGGPEIAEDSVAGVLSRGFDFAVCGMGELAFPAIVGSLGNGKGPGLWKAAGIAWLDDGRLRSNAPGVPPRDLSAIPSPYGPGVVELHRYGELWHENTRGCPYSCTYCSFSRYLSSLSVFPLDLLHRHLRMAREQDIRSAYMMDASFNIQPRIHEILRTIASYNSDRRMAVCCELKADQMQDDLFELLDDANVRSVELGLQSTDQSVLQQINRRCDLRKYLCNAHRLRDRNMNVCVQLILALPGATPDTFRADLHWIADNGVADAVDVYVLNVLPGTVIRQQARALGLEYMHEPPYVVLRTPTLDFQQIKGCLQEYVRISGGSRNRYRHRSWTTLFCSYCRHHYPMSETASAEDAEQALDYDRETPITKAILQQPLSNAQFERVLRLVPEELASPFVLWLCGDWLGRRLDQARELLRRMTALNPFLVLNLMIDGPSGPGPRAAVLSLEDAVQTRIQYLDRYYVYSGSTPEVARRSLRICYLGPPGCPCPRELRDLPSNLGFRWFVNLELGGKRDPSPEAVRRMVTEADGILVDFVPESDSHRVVCWLRELSMLRRNTDIHFRNLTLQLFWDRYIDRNPVPTRHEGTFLFSHGSGRLAFVKVSAPLVEFSLREWLSAVALQV